MIPKLIIFDLDGTLIDSAHDLGTSINHTLLAMGFPALEEQQFRFLVGPPTKLVALREFRDRNYAMRGIL